MTCAHCKNSPSVEMHNEYLCMNCYLDYLVYEGESVMVLRHPANQTLIGYQLGFDGEERVSHVLHQLQSQLKNWDTYVKCQCSTAIPMHKSILVGYCNEIHAFCDSECYFEWRENITNKGVE